MDEIKIQIRFQIKEEGHELNDSLYFTLDEYSKLNQEDIEKMKRSRFDNFIKVITTPIEPIEETEESLKEKLANFQAQQDQLEEQTKEVISQLEEKGVDTSELM